MINKLLRLFSMSEFPVFAVNYYELNSYDYLSKLLFSGRDYNTSGKGLLEVVEFMLLLSLVLVLLL